MKTIKLSQDIEHEGLVAGDVLSVDDNSAAALIRREAATEYDPTAPADGDETNVVEVEATTYGDQEDVRTIDDIRDPQAARNRRVMSFTTVAAPDPGPASPTTAEAEPAEPAAKASKRSGRFASTSVATGATSGATTGTQQAASDAQSAGGDAGGGNS